MIFDMMQVEMKALPVIQCCAPLGNDLSEREAGELEALFGALADKNRVKIVSMLLKAGSDACCVCDNQGLAVRRPRDTRS